MPAKVTLDHAGVAALLKSKGVAAEISAYGARVEAATAGAPEVVRHGMAVSSSDGVSDRVRTVVTIMHPGGLGVQAKHGTLSRAIAAAGLTFRGAS